MIKYMTKTVAYQKNMLFNGIYILIDNEVFNKIYILGISIIYVKCHTTENKMISKCPLA